MALTEDMAIHDQHLARLTTETSPTLREGFGVGAHTAAEADGRTKREIIRGLKRFLAREIYQRVMTDSRARQEIIQAA